MIIRKNKALIFFLLFMAFSSAFSTTSLNTDYGLTYHPVNPCRVVDTRYGLGATIGRGETVGFQSYGYVYPQNQGAGGAPDGYPDNCDFDLGEPEAVHLNVSVLPMGPDGEKGFVTLWPSAEVRPTAAFLNFLSPQFIANAATIKVTPVGEGAPDFSLYTNRKVHVIIDVLGYYK